MANLNIEKLNDTLVFLVKIVPASSKTSICGVLEGMLKIKISAPPQKGKANQSLMKFLAKKLGIKTRQISIISGLTNPVKKIRILNISEQLLLKNLDLEK